MSKAGDPAAPVPREAHRVRFGPDLGFANGGRTRRGPASSTWTGTPTVAACRAKVPVPFFGDQSAGALFDGFPLALLAR